MKRGPHEQRDVDDVGDALRQRRVAVRRTPLREHGACLARGRSRDETRVDKDVVLALSVSLSSPLWLYITSGTLAVMSMLHSCLASGASGSSSFSRILLRSQGLGWVGVGSRLALLDEAST